MKVTVQKTRIIDRPKWGKRKNIMNEVKFKAGFKYAAKKTADKYCIVAINDGGKYDFQNYIILQKAFKFDEQDIETGMDGHYFEVNGQENSNYKACKKVILTNNHLVFYLDNHKISDIERVEIDLSQIKLNKRFVDCLKEILDDILEIKSV
jgi:hypothetical protein